MSAFPAPVPVAPPGASQPVADTASAVAGHVQVTPADSPAAVEFRASAAEPTASTPAISAHETRLATPGAAGGLLPDMARRIDSLSGEMNDWLRPSGPGGAGLAAQAGTLDPAAQMQAMFKAVSEKYMENAMLSMKLNVTNQEMEAVNKDKDQLMRGGS